MRLTRESMFRPILILTGLAASGLALAGAPSAHAQIMAPGAAVSDISVSQDGDKVSILVKLSGQPTSATAVASGDNLVLSVDGVSLTALTLAPPSGNLIRQVAADQAGPMASKVTLSGAAFGQTSTVIYRNAVLIETRLAEPTLAGASLMAAAPPAPKPVPVAAPAPAPVAPPPKPVPVKTTPPAHAEPAHPEAAKHDPIQPAPARPEPEHPAPVPVKAEPAAPISLLPGKTPPPAAPHKAGVYVKLAGLDAAACTDAARKLTEDEWALDALGAQVLCLIDADKDADARKSLDKLAAFSPEDWRVALATAALAERAHDTSTARINYSNARILAPTDALKVGIDDRLEALEDKPAS